MQSPALPTPRTPSSRSAHPLSSSPLTASPSPSSAVQSRRRSQYKAIFTTPSSSSRRTSQSQKTSRAYTTRTTTANSSNSSPNVARALFSLGATDAADEEPPRNKFLRERFKARCLERAQKARDARIQSSRRLSLSSDGDMDMDMDDDDADADTDAEFMLNDELFRRIMASASRKRTHAYRVSYQLDVGSSIDPDMEDIDQWERELQDPAPPLRSGPTSYSVPEDLPSELDDAAANELAAYAEECELWEKLGDTDDLDLFALDELDGATPGASASNAKGKEVMTSRSAPGSDADGDIDMF